MTHLTSVTQGLKAFNVQLKTDNDQVTVEFDGNKLCFNDDSIGSKQTRFESEMNKELFAGLFEVSSLTARSKRFLEGTTTLKDLLSLAEKSLVKSDTNGESNIMDFSDAILETPSANISIKCQQAHVKILKNSGWTGEWNEEEKVFKSSDILEEVINKTLSYCKIQTFDPTRIGSKISIKAGAPQTTERPEAQSSNDWAVEASDDDSVDVKSTEFTPQQAVEFVFKNFSKDFNALSESLKTLINSRGGSTISLKKQKSLKCVLPLGGKATVGEFIDEMSTKVVEANPGVSYGAARSFVATGIVACKGQMTFNPRNGLLCRKPGA